jgi:hypothetical protein
MGARRRLRAPEEARRTERLDLRLTRAERTMLQEVMDAQAASAADLVRQWIKAAHEALT